MLDFLDKMKVKKELSKVIKYNIRKQDLSAILDYIGGSKLESRPVLFNMYKSIVFNAASRDANAGKYYAKELPNYISRVPDLYKNIYLNIISQSITTHFYIESKLAENLPIYLSRVGPDYRKQYTEIILSACSQKCQTGQSLAQHLPPIIESLPEKAKSRYMHMVRVGTLQDVKVGLEIAKILPDLINSMNSELIESYSTFIDETIIQDAQVGLMEAKKLAGFMGKWNDEFITTYHKTVLSTSKINPFTGLSVAQNLPELLEAGYIDKVETYQKTLQEMIRNESFIGRVVAKELPKLLKYPDNTRLEIYKQIVLEITKNDIYAGRAIADKLPTLLEWADEEIIQWYKKIIKEAVRQSPYVGGDLAKILAEQLPGWMKQVEHKYRLKYMELLFTAASKNYKVAKAVAESLPTLFSTMSLPNITHFVESGLDLIDENEEKALAYFTMQSKFARDRLGKLKNGLPIKDVARTLRLYARAHSGQEINVKPISQSPVSYSGILPNRSFTDGKVIYLPDEIARYPDRDKNFLIYKLITAMEAGYIEFGTFDFALDEYQLQKNVTLEPAIKNIADSDNSVPDMEIYISSFEYPDIARDIFKIFEYGRVFGLIRIMYPGLIRDAASIIDDSKDERPNPNALGVIEQIMEYLARLIYYGKASVAIPEKYESVINKLFSYYKDIPENDPAVYDTAYMSSEAYKYLMDVLGSLSQEDLDGGEDDKTKADGSSDTEGDQEQKDEDDGMPDFFPGVDCASYNPSENMPFQGDLRHDLFQWQEDKRDSLKQQIDEILEEENMQSFSKPMEEWLDNTDMNNLPDTVEDMCKLFEEYTNQEEGEEKQGLAQYLESLCSQGKGNDLFISGSNIHYYDEWDCNIEDYRLKWVTLHEIIPDKGNLDLVNDVIYNHKNVLKRIRYQFELLKPEGLKRLKKQFDGDNIDIDSVTEAIIDIKTKHTPDDRLYIRRDRKERSVSVAFLIDMSNSTSKEINIKGKSILDVERESLILMSEALEALGDSYAIYGFSGRGRNHSEFYVFKDFDDSYNDKVRERIGGMSPLSSTRLGPAIRHSVSHLNNQDSRVKILILLSDGKPVDNDAYDGRYAQDDTRIALNEARRQSIHTYCITVDTKAQGYLDDMFGSVHYTIIQDVHSLPEKLPRIYRKMTT